MPDPQALLRPLSAEAPCGPDLDAAGDLDYMNLMARIEGDLPASFFSFDRAAIDFKADEAALAGLLERSLDLRLVVVLAKLAILNRDLDAFGAWLSTLCDLLSNYWDGAHPAVADGQSALRGAVLQSLDDLPTVILPLQYAPLFSSRRLGAVSFRTHLVASGEVARRDGEPEVDAAALAQALATTERDELAALRDILQRVSASVEGIRTTWITQAGFEDAPTLERLAKLSARMSSFIAEEVARRDPEIEPGSPAPEPDMRGDDGALLDKVAKPDEGRLIGSSTAAAYALAAAARYLAHAEPSSPALLLVCQAQRLVGRSFADIVQIVMPDAYDDARITVGADQPFVFRLDRLPEVELPSVSGLDDGEAEEPSFELESRRDVQKLLGEVAAFYRSAEPSNPIPLICERARALCSLDFLTLIRDMIPKQ